MTPSSFPALLLAILLGSMPAAAAQTPPDTTRPTIPQDDTWLDDSLHTIIPPDNPGVVYYRTLVDIEFHPTVAGVVIRRFLAQYRATIVGGIPWMGVYTLQLPDPGPTWDATQACLRRLRAEKSVKWVGLMMRSGPPGGF
jgi:hypothetical protein